MEVVKVSFESVAKINSSREELHCFDSSINSVNIDTKQSVALTRTNLEDNCKRTKDCEVQSKQGKALQTVKM